MFDLYVLAYSIFGSSSRTIIVAVPLLVLFCPHGVLSAFDWLWEASQMIKLAELRILPSLSVATHTDVLSGHHSFLPHERISGCTVRSRQSFMGKELVIR